MINRAAPYGLWLLLAGGVVVSFSLSLMVGPASVGAGTLWTLIQGGDGGTAGLILQEVRLPRALLGLLVGASLGLSGAALQGYLKNPLAEPGLIGVSSSAALGAVVVIHYGLAGAFAMALPLGGMVGALLGMLIVQRLAGRHGGTLSLILAGVAVSAFAGALTSLALNLSGNRWAMLEIVFWLMGSLENRSMEHLWLAAPFMLAGWGVLFALRRPLDALTLGEDAARSLGFRIGRVRWLLVVGTTLSVGAATAVTGAIGFVGLVVPHLLRPWVAHRPGMLLPASAMGGAIMLLLADTLVRVAAPASELKLGVMTALLGAPFFLWLILKLKRSLP